MIENNKAWKKIYSVQENADGHAINDYINGVLGYNIIRKYSNSGETIYVPFDYYKKILSSTQALLLRRNPNGLVKWVDFSSKEIEREYDNISIGAIILNKDNKDKDKLKIGEIFKIIGDKNIRMHQVPNGSYCLVDYKLDINNPDSNFSWKNLRTEGYSGIVDIETEKFSKTIVAKANLLKPYIDSYYSTDYDGYINVDSVIKPQLIKK